MRTQNLTSDQDSTLTDCEDFGGKAGEAAEMVKELDGKLSEAKDEIEQLKEQVKELENK